MDTSSPEEVRKLYEKTADSYKKMMDNEIDLPVYADTLSRLAVRITDIPGPVVDTSCGSGHMLDLYRRRYDPQRDLVGIDLSPRMVEITQKKLGPNSKIMIADMRNLSMLSSGSSAAVINYFALHHLDRENVRVAIKEWNRILRPEGQLVIATWEGSGPIDYGDESDVVALRYTKDEVTSWVRDSGFIIDLCIVEPVEGIPMEVIYMEATQCCL